MLNNNKYKNRASRKYSTRSSFLEKKRRRVKVTIGIILSLIVLIGILYLLFFSSLFSIKNIEVSFKSGPFLTNREEVLNIIQKQTQKKHFLGLSQKNVFVFNSNLFYNKAQNDSRIESAVINKDIIPPCKLLIEVNETKPVANLRVLSGGHYFISSKGKVIKYEPPSDTHKKPSKTLESQASPPQEPSSVASTQSIQEVSISENNLNKGKNFDIKTLPTIYDKTQLNLTSKKTTNIFKKVINFINSGVLTRNRIELSKIDIIERSGGVIEIQIFTNEDWIIYLTSETNFKNQTKNLELALQNELKDTKGLEYVDLRFENRIFYKYQKEIKQTKDY